MRNLEGIRDSRELAEFEYAATDLRRSELEADQGIIARTYDAGHVRAIHAYLFQDMYEWAGQYRTVNISKGAPSGFADVRSGQIERYLADVHRFVRETEWSDVDRARFIERVAVVFAYLNQAHPFREGNGRAAKVFIDHVAEQSQFVLEYSRIEPTAWNQASLLSGPDLGTYMPHPDALVPVFGQIEYS